MKRFLLSAAIAAIIAPNAFGQAADIPIDADEDIISIGQRIGVSQAANLTSPVSVITETEIAARGQQYISDLLRSLPGIAVNSSGPAGGLTQIRVREVGGPLSKQAAAKRLRAKSAPSFRLAGPHYL